MLLAKKLQKNSPLGYRSVTSNTFWSYLENVICTFSAKVMLAGEDNHRLRKHLQAYGTNQLFLQVVHVIHFSNNFPGRKKKDKTKHHHDNTLRNGLRRLMLRWWDTGGRPAAPVLVGAVSFSPAAVTSVFSSQSALTSVVAIFALTIFESEQASTEQLPSRRSMALC